MAKKRELTEMQTKFIEALFTEESKGKPFLAKKIAGYSDNVRTQELIDSLHEEIVEYGKRVLAANSASAVFAMLHVLENPSDAGSVVKLKAASEIMNRVGINKSDADTIKIPDSGLVILPAKKVTVEVDVDDDSEG